MNERDAADASGDSSEMPVVDADGNEKRRKKRVIPYVEDRRNILSLTLDEPLREAGRAVADVRPGARHRGRLRAGGLRADQRAAAADRRAARPDAVHRGRRGRRRRAAAARRPSRTRWPGAAAGAGDLPLRPGRRADRGGPHPRPALRTRLLRLPADLRQPAPPRRDRPARRARPAAARSPRRRDSRDRQGESTAPSSSPRLTAPGRTPHAGGASSSPGSSERGLRLPDEAQTLVTEALARPDFVYRLPGANVAVFVDGPVHDDAAVARARRRRRGTAARRRAGTSIRFPHDGDWAAIAAEHATTSAPAPAADLRTADSDGRHLDARKPRMTTFSAGSLVTARGRDWVVLPDSAPDLLVLRPLGGADDDVAAVFPRFEEVTRRRVRATRRRPTSATAPAAGLLRTALRIGFRSGAGPFRSLAGIAVEPRAYQLVPLLMALRQQTVRHADLRRRRHRQDRRGRPDRQRTARPGRGASGLAVLCSPALAEQWQERAARPSSASTPNSSSPPRSPGWSAAWTSGQSLFDRHPHVDRLHRLHQVDPAPRRLRPALPRPGHRRRGPHLRRRRRHRLRRRTSSATSCCARRRGRRPAPAAGDRHPAQRQGERLPQPARPGQAGTRRPSTSSTDAGRRLLAPHFVQRKRADVRQYLTKDDGLADDSLAEETVVPRRPALQGRDLQAVPGLPGAARRRHRLRQRAGRARRTAGPARGRGSPGGRRSRCCARWSPRRAPPRRPCAPARRPRRPPAPRRPTGSAPRSTSDSADSDALEGLDVAPGADDRRRGRTPGGAGSRELADQAAELEGPDRGPQARRPRHAAQGAAQATATTRSSSAATSPPPSTSPSTWTASSARKTVVRAVTGTLSPQQRIDRIEELAEAAGDDRPPAGCWSPPTASPRASTSSTTSTPSSTTTSPGTPPATTSGRAGSTGSASSADVVRAITLYGERQRHRRQGPRRPDQEAPADPQGPRHLRLRPRRRLRRSDRRDRRVAAAARPGRRRAGSLFDARRSRPSTKAAALDADWQSAAEREKTSRSRFAQHAIHPEEVAREVAAVRDTLGRAAEVRGFVRQSLRALDGVLRDDPARPGDFTADAERHSRRAARRPRPGAGRRRRRAGTPGPVPQHGRRRRAARPPWSAPTRPSVALAGYVLNAALDAAGQQALARPAAAASSGPRAVDRRTTLLLVRYRFHLTLPSRTATAAGRRGRPAARLRGRTRPTPPGCPPTTRWALLERRPPTRTPTAASASAR